MMDLIVQGWITQNLIEPSYELVDTSNTYWTAIMPPDQPPAWPIPSSIGGIP
jgi:hypothetical protein